MSSDSAWKKFFIVLSEIFRYIGEGKRKISDTTETLQLLINHNPQSLENFEISEHDIIQKIIAAIQLGKLRVAYIPKGEWGAGGTFEGYDKNGMLVFTFYAEATEYIPGGIKWHVVNHRITLLHYEQRRTLILNWKDEDEFFIPFIQKLSKESKQKFLNEFSKNLK